MNPPVNSPAIKVVKSVREQVSAEEWKTRVDLAANQLDISHLVGRGAVGSIVANAADNRSIDVATSVDIDLAGVRPDQIGGAVVRASNLALETTGQHRAGGSRCWKPPSSKGPVDWRDVNARNGFIPYTT